MDASDILNSSLKDLDEYLQSGFDLSNREIIAIMRKLIDGIQKLEKQSNQLDRRTSMLQVVGTNI